MDLEVGLKINPKVVIDEKTNQKMEMLIDMISTEVGWYGLVEREGQDTFRIKEIYLLEQEVNGGTTEISSQALAQLSDKLDDERILTEENFNKLGLYMWGHSHADMDPSPSGQDENQFMHIFKTDKPPFFIRLIQNKRKDRTVTLYIEDKGSDMCNYMIFGDVPFIVESEGRDAIRKELEAEVKEKVKQKVIQTNTVINNISKSSKTGKETGYNWHDDWPDQWMYEDYWDPYNNAVSEYNEYCKKHKPEAKVEKPKSESGKPQEANVIDTGIGIGIGVTKKTKEYNALTSNKTIEKVTP